MITNRNAARLGALLVALSALAAVLPLERQATYVLAPIHATIPVDGVADVREGSREGEIVRIQTHLERVERELREADVAHLTAAQQAAREVHLNRLREYREAGSFPHNHDFPGTRVPYFVDAHGTPCAVAYLMARSGHQEVGARVAKGRNHAYLPELTDDEEVVAWLAQSGLSVDEAARIQPTYGYFPPPYPDPADEVSSGYALATAVNLGLAGATVAWNLSWESDEGSWWPGGVGVAAGAAGLGIGASKLDERGTPQVLGIVNAAAGIMSLALGARSLSRSRGEPGATPSAAVASGRELRMQASPLLGADGGAGFSVRLRF